MRFQSVSLPRSAEGIIKILMENSGKMVDVQVDELNFIVGTLIYIDYKTYGIYEENGKSPEYRIDDLKRLAIRTS